jgi:GDP-4-dehydro-6-deoxy-D-mannose reductase
LVELADHVIEPVIDSALFRPVDVPSIVGSAARLSNLTGWAPRIPIEETLADVLAYWRTELER